MGLDLIQLMLELYEDSQSSFPPLQLRLKLIHKKLKISHSIALKLKVLAKIFAGILHQVHIKQFDQAPLLFIRHVWKAKHIRLLIVNALSRYVTIPIQNTSQIC